jgi:hypothetical protein
MLFLFSRYSAGTELGWFGMRTHVDRIPVFCVTRALQGKFIAVALTL